MRILITLTLAATLTAAGPLDAARGRQQPAGPARPVIAGVAHATIQVSDLVKARKFYGDLLGYTEVPSVDRAHVAVFAVNDRQRLIVRDGLPPDRDERFINLAFEVGDAEAMRAWLVARGMQAGQPAPDVMAGGRRIDVADPDAHALQFVERDRPTRARPAAVDARLSKRILHAGLTVKDSAAADRFYKDTLGFSETWRGGRPEGVINWINMRVPDGTDYLEYMLYPTTPPTRRQLGSAHHVALLVTDIQQALETVRSRTAADDPNHRANPNIGTNNRWQLNLFDPDGTRVELMEPWTVR
jgi:catechol 2,3-dioxygenase-like lactoylglutathione lyase family enzyme